ncbi:MAG: AbrB/MazE/SpoVT family DNA-binding domain-containing protein [Acholeplasmatales bacterium]|nr:AbrB/MazE/SpoVT family DNA-binding domain-containing protein [Acholeplasmatales bacterium]
MKETGVIRRLDELGRVVIPKEIRKRLKINSGDMVDIFTLDEKIVLEKYHPLDQDITSLRALLESLRTEYNIDFIVFDDSKIIYSTLDNIYQESITSQSFISKIDNYLARELSSKLNLEIVEGKPINKEMIIERIFVDYEHYGYVCVIDDIISKKQKEVLGIINSYFQFLLSEE